MWPARTRASVTCSLACRPADTFGVLVTTLPTEPASAPLRYTAQAGLLPELTRQTYDVLHKALREAVLNALDAGASEVRIDTTRAAREGVLVVEDDGCGMRLADVESAFLGVGGSLKAEDASKFGRLGVGCLALLAFGESTILETKVADASTYTRAVIPNPANLGRADRRQVLAALVAGVAESLFFQGERSAHFTRLTVHGLGCRERTDFADVSRFYDLIARLRRVLPVPWQAGRVLASLSPAFPDAVQDLMGAAARHSGNVLVLSTWQPPMALRRLVFGDEVGEGERAQDWAGLPHAFSRAITVGGDRKLMVAGYLLPLKHADPDWAGLTVRVQNTTVAENTFFGLRRDPGFLRYVTGEVHLSGDLEFEHLLRFDRASFNEDASDYLAVQRLVQAELEAFKRDRVQRLHRLKAQGRHVLRSFSAIGSALARVSAGAELTAVRSGGLVSSGVAARSLREAADVGLLSRLTELGIRGIPVTGRDGHTHRIEVNADGSLDALVCSALLEPKVCVRNANYPVQFVDAGSRLPPVIVQNRPRRLSFNLGHPLFEKRDPAAAVEIALALEMATANSWTRPGDRRTVTECVRLLSRSPA